MTNIHLKVLRSPRLRVSERVPYVAMGDPLMAWRVSLVLCCLSVGEGGRALTSAPVSTRKRVLEVRSWMK